MEQLISRAKKYLKCYYCYLISIVHKDSDIEDDLRDRIAIDWLKWRTLLNMLCNNTYYVIGESFIERSVMLMILSVK